MVPLDPSRTRMLSSCRAGWSRGRRSATRKLDNCNLDQRRKKRSEDAETPAVGSKAKAGQRKGVQLT